MRVIRLDQLEQFAAVKISDDPGAIGGPKLVPQTAQITLMFGLESGITAHVNLYGRYAGAYAGTPAQANAIKSALGSGSAWVGLAAHLATSTSLQFVTIRNIAVEDSASEFSNTASAPGTSTGTALPSETAVVLTKRTAFTGPSGRGRAYIPGWATTALGSGNVVAAPALSALNTWGATINGALSAQGYTHVLALPARAAYTGSTGTQHPARAATTRDVTAVQTTDNHWDTQRRRGLK